MKPESNWKSTTTEPPEPFTYILIKTKTGLVRVAKLVKYLNGDESYTYGSMNFRNVIWWQPLPK